MLAVGGIGPSAAALRTPNRGQSEPREAQPAPGRALIPVAAPAPTERATTATRRPLAAFLAHLIATQANAPQTRTRRRAEPGEVLGVYSAASALRQPAYGKFRREA